MNSRKVIIIGSSGHSKVIIDIIQKQNIYEILGIIDSDKKRIGHKVLGYEIIGADEDLPRLITAHNDCQLFVAIGDNWKRKMVVEKIIEANPNVEFATVIHPNSNVASNVKIGRGSAVMAGAIINCDTNIGDFVIVNTNASVDHDCSLDDFSSMAPGSTTGGNVHLGKCTAISIGATIKHGISVGSHSVIGAGAVLINNCADNLVMFGVPAKIIRKREYGEIYL